MMQFNQFMFGANAMGFLIAGLFFLRFWRKTADDLFVAFSAAFLLFAIDQFLHSLQQAFDWSENVAFLFRLAGFGLLIIAIFRKNMK